MHTYAGWAEYILYSRLERSLTSINSLLPADSACGISAKKYTGHRRYSKRKVTRKGRGRIVDTQSRSRGRTTGAKMRALGNAVRETNAILRLISIYPRRNFNGVDDIRRFADAGNQIGPVCHRHTNKRYADTPRVGFIFPVYDGGGGGGGRSDRELARNNSPSASASELFIRLSADFVCCLREISRRTYVRTYVRIVDVRARIVIAAIRIAPRHNKSPYLRVFVPPPSERARDFARNICMLDVKINGKNFNQLGRRCNFNPRVFTYVTKLRRNYLYFQSIPASENIINGQRARFLLCVTSSFPNNFFTDSGRGLKLFECYADFDNIC